MRLEAPTLVTPRLTLRAHKLDDIDASAALWGDPAVTRRITGRPLSREEVRSRLLRYAGHWRLLGFGYWVVEERASTRFLGEVGFADYQRRIDGAIAAAMEGRPEAGWALHRAAQGHGYAAEALRAALDWADSALASPETVCFMTPDNAASLRLARSVGYRDMGLARYRDDDVIALRRLRPTRPAPAKGDP